MTNEVKNFDELDNIQSMLLLFGLNFPESATEYQKAALTLAHLMIAVRDAVLKGRDVTPYLSDHVYNLCQIMQDNESKQR